MNPNKYWNNKKYWILLPIFLGIGVLLFIWLPEKNKKLIILVPIVFWATYYAWIYIENIRKSREKDH